MKISWRDLHAVKKYINKSPFYKTLSMKILSTDTRGSIVRVKTGHKHKNLWGTIHGGVMASITDSACGISVIPYLKDGETIVTTSLEIHYFAPAEAGELTAHGTMIHRGRRLAHAEAKIYDERKKLIAKGSASFVIARKERD